MLKLACALGVSSFAFVGAAKNAGVSVGGSATAPVVENTAFGVEYVGNSGQFKLYYKADSKRAVKVNMMKLEEVAKDGKVTDHKVASWANFATAWTATDGVCPPGTSADTCTKVSFSTDLDVANSKPRFTFDTYLIHTTTDPIPICTAFNTNTSTCDLFRCRNVGGDGKQVDCVNHNGTYCVEDATSTATPKPCNSTGLEIVTFRQEQNTLKFSVGISDWPFKSVDNTLSFGVVINDIGGTGDFNVTNSNATEITEVLTPSGSLKLEQYVTVVDQLGQASTQKCIVSTDKNNVIMSFPSFTKAMAYDPTLALATSGSASKAAQLARPVVLLLVAAVTAMLAQDL